MKINPDTLDLFTDSGKFLKTLACPYKERWEGMVPNGPATRLCGVCCHEVHDTSLLDDDALEQLLAANPSACLMVSAAQKNCTVVLPPSRSFLHRPGGASGAQPGT